MKYYEVELTITPCTQDAQDLLSALSAEAGFESFEETATGLLAYAQQSLFDQEVLDAAISTFPIEGTKIIYNVSERVGHTPQACNMSRVGLKPCSFEGMRTILCPSKRNCRES